MPDKKKPKEYRVKDHINWVGEDGHKHGASPSELRDDIPEESIPWLLKHGHIADPDEEAKETRGAIDKVIRSGKVPTEGAVEVRNPSPATRQAAKEGGKR